MHIILKGQENKLLISMSTIKVVNHSKHELPQYETDQSAGMDIRANINESITLKPLERKLIKTGLFIALEKGIEAQIRPSC